MDNRASKEKSREEAEEVREEEDEELIKEDTEGDEAEVEEVEEEEGGVMEETSEEEMEELTRPHKGNFKRYFCNILSSLTNSIAVQTCRDYNSQGGCTRGDNCQWYHNCSKVVGPGRLCWMSHPEHQHQ